MSRLLPVLPIVAAALHLAACGTKSDEPQYFPAATESEGALYTASAASKQLPFEMTVSEVRRTPTKSYLLIPGFRHRTAPQARWSMCIFTDLAMARGFKYWAVVYPPEQPAEEQLVVALSNDGNASPAELLGTDYVQERMLDDEMTAASVLLKFCRSLGYL
jgi:hypothetical protein